MDVARTERSVLTPAQPLQFMRTSAYIQVVGRFDQAGINLNPTDSGGELDPHGADLVRLRTSSRRVDPHLPRSWETPLEASSTLPACPALKTLRSPFRQSSKSD